MGASLSQWTVLPLEFLIWDKRLSLSICLIVRLKMSPWDLSVAFSPATWRKLVWEHEADMQWSRALRWGQRGARWLRALRDTQKPTTFVKVYSYRQCVHPVCFPVYLGSFQWQPRGWLTHLEGMLIGPVLGMYQGLTNVGLVLLHLTSKWKHIGQFSIIEVTFLWTSPKDKRKEALHPHHKHTHPSNPNWALLTGGSHTCFEILLLQ